MRRKNEERLHQKSLEWFPPGRKRKRISRNSWMLEVTTEIREKVINSIEWIDGKNRK